ncbi:MAG: hypothetical protein LBM25_06145 [Bacteroidales bacterium]|jgi:hypothetical protein|nr:hypothetical protein [Bacteroidales bacterium]
MELWNNDVEINFLQQALESFATKEQLFYKLNDEYYVYVPKGENSYNQTMQSRNSLVGQFTEKWCNQLLSSIAKEFNLYAVNGVICQEIGLTKQSRADLCFCTTNDVVQKAENIKLLFEIKMSIVSNYKYVNNEKIEFVGDYKTHNGNPSLLRSDSMLKAIGKSINIRVEGISSRKIPIVVLGNSPITKGYIDKVDYLQKAGIVQGFWSLNPTPTNMDFIKQSPNKSFDTIYNKNQLLDKCSHLLKEDLNFFSSMMSKQRLGEIIFLASKETSDEKIAEKFLTLIN